MDIRLFLLFFGLSFLFALTRADALDDMDGRMRSVPAPGVVTIDGDFGDWDLSGREWVAISADIAERFSGEVMLMHDDDYLYIGAEIRTAGGPMVNTNKPGEKPWLGHELEFRCIAHPDVPYPLRVNANNPADPSVAPWVDRIKTVTLWMETVTRTPHAMIANGPPYHGEIIADPEGVDVAFSETGHPDRYRLEARVAWKVLGVPDGKNPFRPGQAMTAFWTVMWPQSITQRAECLRLGPTGNFGYDWYQIHNWGRVLFSPVNNLPRTQPDLAGYLAALSTSPSGDVFVVELPRAGLLSVNIVDGNGDILREVVGGAAYPAGPARIAWDGYDWRGNPMKPGPYAWKAYLHDPLELEFTGAAGTSARVPYESADGKGNWGGNMGPPTGVAVHGTDRYYLWGSNEGGHSIVKVDADDQPRWRNTPYVIGGGYGPHVALAANAKYVYVVSGWFNSFLTRFDAATGLTAPFADERFLRLDDWGDTPPQPSEWNTPVPAVNSIVCTEDEVFVPLHYRGRIAVYDAVTGHHKRDLPLAYPRAVTLDDGGHLWAVSQSDSTGWHFPGGWIHQFENARGDGRRAFQLQAAWNIRNPWSLAVRNGTIFVSDNGYTNQIWRFANGQPAGVIGRSGGRPWKGLYRNTDLLRPAGLAWDDAGKLFVAQSALPNVIQRYDAATLALEKELFGDVGYCPPAWPDADDPLLVYVKEYFTNGLIRSPLPGDGTSGGVDAYWRFDTDENWPRHLGLWAANFRVPLSFRGPHNRKYMFAAGLHPQPATLVLTEGVDFRPVNSLGATPDGRLEVWTDRDGDSLAGPGETVVHDRLGPDVPQGRGGHPWSVGVSQVLADGTLYLVGSDNAAYRIPLRRAWPGGALEWDFDAARCVARDIIPDYPHSLHYTARETVMGVDVDTAGNTYFSYNANLEYARPAWTDALRFGLGHTGRFNAVKITSFDPSGKRRFLAGRKATGILKPGEMYHHWAQAGMIGDHYVGVASEWTPMTLYTTDGFFVQSLLTDPNRGETPDPFTIGGGETFSGQLRYYPERNACYLYTGNTHGMVYRIKNLAPGGRVPGEARFDGVMTLTQTVDLVSPQPPPENVVFVPLENPRATGHWGDAPVTLRDNDGEPLAVIHLGYDADNLHVRFRVKSNKPFVNRADDPALVFKHGDAVGLYLGKPGRRDQVDDSHIRLLATVFQDRPTVVAMRPFSPERKRPYDYFTTSSGRRSYEFVGELPGAVAVFTPEADGYIMEVSVPRAELPDLDWKVGGEVALEAEVLKSGFGVRGLQAIARNHLFTPRTAGQAKMVDDIPAEARIYPQYLGRAEIR